MQSARYELWVRDAGATTRKVLIDDWLELRFRPTVNNYAGFSFKLHQDSSHASSVESGDWLEIVRKVQDPLTLAWTTQTFGYIILARERTVDENGKGSEYITYNGLDFKSLLMARRILPPSTSTAYSYLAMAATSGADRFTISAPNNPGFETAGGGGADVFAVWIDVAGDGSVVDETSIVKSGSHSARLTAGASANTQIAYVYYNPNISITYTLTFWTRGDGTNAGRYQVLDTGSHDAIAKKSTGVTGTSWTQVSESFTILPESTYIQVNLWCPVAAGGVAYFDDVTLTCSLDLYTGDKVTPTTTTTQARIIKTYASGTSFEVTSQFTANVSGESFSVQRARSIQTDAADDVMKAYVRGCLTAAVDTSRNLSYFSVESDEGAAGSVTWTARYTRLLGVLRDISAESDVDFDVEFNGTTGILKFVTAYPQLGLDRRVNNPDGNAPVIFAIEFGNIANQRWWESALAMVDHGGNYLYIGGNGEGVNRTILQRQHPGSILKWGRWESFVDARDAHGPNDLVAKADAAVESIAALDLGVTFDAIQTDGCLWGIHYNLGDLVTAKVWREPSTYISNKILAIEVDVSEDGGIEKVQPFIGEEYPRFDRRFGRLQSQQDKEMTLD